MAFSDALRRELTSDILPFWMSRMEDPSGGFYGRMDGKGGHPYTFGEGRYTERPYIVDFRLVLHGHNL